MGTSKNWTAYTLRNKDSDYIKKISAQRRCQSATQKMDKSKQIEYMKDIEKFLIDNGVDVKYEFGNRGIFTGVTNGAYASNNIRKAFRIMERYGIKEKYDNRETENRRQS